MEILRTLVRIGQRLLAFAGQFLLSLLRLFRQARRIRRNTAGWQALPGQVEGAAAL